MSQNSVKNLSLSLETSPESFFFELVRSAVDHQKVKLQPETEFYLVKLLNRFIFSESLYSKNSEGALEDQPLALMYKDALESEEPGSQKTLFQNVGDISLYKAGFFSESLTKAKVDVNYVASIGGAAYHNAAERSEDKHFRGMFSELSSKFVRMVDVLSEVSEQTSVPASEQDLFRLYDMWTRTGSERAARALKKAGIKLDSE
jgi:hypothetical protein